MMSLVPFLGRRAFDNDRPSLKDLGESEGAGSLKVRLVMKLSAGGLFWDSEVSKG